MGFVGIRDGAIERAKLIDAELGWYPGLAIGKMAMIWYEVFKLELPVVRRKFILLWAGELPGDVSDDDFINALTDPDFGFLRPLDDGGDDAQPRRRHGCR